MVVGQMGQDGSGTRGGPDLTSGVYLVKECERNVNALDLE